jgi:hypothetical protein
MPRGHGGQALPRCCRAVICRAILETPSLRQDRDVVLALGGWWAVLAGRRAGGKLFGEHGHWSSLVVALPIGFAIAAAAELWHLLRGGA